MLALAQTGYCIPQLHAIPHALLIHTTERALAKLSIFRDPPPRCRWLLVWARIKHRRRRCLLPAIEYSQQIALGYLF